MRFAAVIVLALAVASACDRSSGPPVVVSNVVITAPGVGMPMASGYLEISNRSGSNLRISRVTSPNYAAVEMHETTVEDGIARMREISVLEIAKGETVVFERGGKHLMLMKPVGTVGTITLNFYADDVLLLSVNTEFAGAME